MFSDSLFREIQFRNMLGVVHRELDFPTRHRKTQKLLLEYL